MFFPEKPYELARSYELAPYELAEHPCMICYSGFLKTSYFLERILVERIDMKISLNSIFYLCFITILSRNRVIFEN